MAALLMLAHAGSVPHVHPHAAPLIVALALLAALGFAMRALARRSP
jgi:hypothetical protein